MSVLRPHGTATLTGTQARSWSVCPSLVRSSDSTLNVSCDVLQFCPPHADGAAGQGGHAPLLPARDLLLQLLRM